jgi:hypothetical protein
MHGVSEAAIFARRFIFVETFLRDPQCRLSHHTMRLAQRLRQTTVLGG